MESTKGCSAKLLIETLLDENSFVELGTLVSTRTTDFNLNADVAPSDGVITGYGLIGQKLVYVYAQNAEVLNGTMGEMHCKKIAQIYAMAVKTGAPVIGILDSAGFRVQESCDALEGFGQVLRAVNEAKGIVPMFCVVHGNCGGGLSMIPALSDFSFMEKDKGRLYVNSPNTIPGNYTEKNDTAGSKYQSLYSGVVEDVCDYDEICEKILGLLTILPANELENRIVCENEVTDDLNRAVEHVCEEQYNLDTLVSEIADNYEVIESKKNYAPDMMTGFIRLAGMTVGVIGNRAGEKDSMLTADGLSKAAEFVEFCDSFHIPVLTITDVDGFSTEEKTERVLAREMSRFVRALAKADTVKINLIPRKAYGSAYIVMNAKSIGADLTIGWSKAQLGAMKSDVAGKIIGCEINTEICSSAAHGAVDILLEPENTRKYLISGFDMLSTKKHFCR